MNIVTTTCVYPSEIPEEERLTRLADIGFTCLDLALDCLTPDHPLLGERWRDWLSGLREKAENRGVRYTHSHAWGNCGAVGLNITRCFEACAFLKIPYTVVHPIHQKPDGSFFTEKDEFIEVNARAVRYILKLAEEYGVTALVENILWAQSAELDAITGLVDAVDSPFFGWCFDTGHINCLHKEISSLRTVSRAPLSLHIHDNYGKSGPFGKDAHLLPGDGTVDWKEFLDILHKIDYKGDLVLEAHHQSIEAPDDRRDAILSELFSRSQKMRAYYLGETDKLF